MNASTPIADLRRDYKMASLDAQDLAGHPVDQFARWFEQALAAQVPEPNAMTLATVTAQNRPSARIVLLKGFDHEGFTFFTNYESRKGEEMASHPHACLVFNWLELERQVRIEGRVEKVSEAESDAYFKIRPLASRYGAWASPQSRVIADRQVLIDREASLRPQYGEDPPRPAHWGGYRVVPEQLEFWQGRRSRLHDRFRYRQGAGPGSAPWLIERLAP